MGVFQADGVRVFSTAGLCRKLRRCQVIQTAMWSSFVVIMPPVGDDTSSLEEVLEPTDSQAFLAQLAVKALHVAILRRLAGLDMDQIDPPVQSSGKEVTAG